MIVNDARRTRGAWAQRIVPAVGLAVVIFTALAGAVGQAEHKPLWHDEIYTLYIATAGRLSAVLATFTIPVDFTPPGYHLAVFLAHKALGQGPLVTRLPAVLGFAVALLSLFGFVNRLAGRIPAVAAAATLAMSGAYPYAYEARPYALVLGLSGLALLSWQGATRDGGWRWHIALAVALAAALATHYYAVLLFAPLALAEFVRWFERRRIPWRLIAAVVSSMAVLLPLLPLMRVVRKFNEGGYWAPPRLDALLEAYRDLAGPLVIPLLVIVMTLVLTRMAFGTHERAEALRTPAVPVRAEVVAVLALAAMPIVICYSLAQVTGAFVARYVIEALFGIAALAGLAVAVIEANGKRSAKVVALVLAGLVAGKTLPAVRFIGAPPQDPFATAVKKAFSTTNAPIAVNNVLTYLQLWHYAAPAERARLVSLTTPADLSPITGARNLAMLARLVPLRIERYDDWVASHDRFLALGPGTEMTEALLRSGATMSLLASGPDALYEVRLR